MISDIRDYIVVLENIVPDALCDEVLSEYKESNNWDTAKTIDGIDRDTRKCDFINISNSLVIQQNSELRKDLDKKLFNCANLAIRNYNEKFPSVKIQGDSGYILLRYKENEFYTEHTDQFTSVPRSVSCSFALNDGYDGGEFAFFGNSFKYKLPKGAALMFPSNFMYPHQVLPVTRGVRYSIVTWFV